MIQGHRLHAGSASRSLSLVFALALAFALMPFSGAFAQTAEDEPDGRFENTVELDAAGNVDAAIAWSQFTFDDGSSDTAMIGRADKFPDNLASSLIQGQEDAPLLLTPSNELAQEVQDELERLGVQTVHVLGGDAAIDESVVNALEAAGYTVHRDAGVTRIETAIDIAQTHAPNATQGLLVRAFGGPSGDETQAWADALAAGGWAADAGMPVFLTQSNELNDNLRDYLEDSEITQLTIIGGSAAIDPSVEAELQAMGITVNRVAGANRFATAIEIAEARGFADPSDAGSVILVEGQAQNAWASGFAAAAYADLSNGVIVLSNGENLPPETEAYLQGTDADNDGVNDAFEPQGHTDDPRLVCGPFVNPSACAEAAAIMGFPPVVGGEVNATFIDVPELVSAEVGRTSGDTTIVRYVFDEPIDDVAVDENDFVLYRYDGTQIDNNDESRTSDANPNVVDVEFDADDAVLATTAAVLRGAVEDEDGNDNIEGSAPLQDVILEGGETVAPDLVEVQLDGSEQEAVYVFDEDVDTAAVAAAGGFQLIVDPDGDTATQDGQEITGTVTGVDDEEVTVSFASPLFDTDDEEDDVLFAAVEAGSVGDEETGDTDENVPQSIEFSDDTNMPLLERVTIDAEEDEATFEFSEQLTAHTATEFELYDALGQQVGTQTGSSVDDNEVTITYEDDTFEDDLVVLAAVDDGAVTDDDGDVLVGPQTLDIEGATFSAGETIAPDLEAASFEEDLDSFGEFAGFELRLDFDEVVDDDDITESRIVGYEDDGDRRTGIVDDGDCDVAADESVVVCTIDEDEAENIEVIVLEEDAVTDGTTGNYPVAIGFEGAEDDGTEDDQGTTA